jgi:hypothetical protein
MALKITEECINCGACEPNAPTRPSRWAIVLRYRSGQVTECVGHLRAPMRFCLPDRCLRARPDHKETHDELSDKDRKLHKTS